MSKLKIIWFFLLLNYTSIYNVHAGTICTGNEMISINNLPAVSAFTVNIKVISVLINVIEITAADNITHPFSDLIIQSLPNENNPYIELAGPQGVLLLYDAQNKKATLMLSPRRFQFITSAEEWKQEYNDHFQDNDVKSEMSCN